MILGKVDVLKTDHDCLVERKWIEAYVKVILLVCRMFNRSVLWVRMCRSEHKGLHFYIAIVPSVTAVQANLLQWLLLDDHRRVSFNRARILSGLEGWSKMFEKPHVRLRTIYRSPQYHLLKRFHSSARASSGLKVKTR